MSSTLNRSNMAAGGRPSETLLGKQQGGLLQMDDSQQPPQAAIEQLAQFLLEVSAAHPIAAECVRCGQESSHHHQGLAYCELCRGCYEPEPRTDLE